MSSSYRPSGVPRETCRGSRLREAPFHVKPEHVKPEHGDSDQGATPPAPPEAAVVFGDRTPLAERYVAHLVSTGVAHGLLGPREVPRIWHRHILNCAVLTDLLPTGARVCDIGSGAGLPGIALAIRRPDLTVTLVEPLLRRVTWLERVLGDLQVPNVAVVRGRAQDVVGQIRVHFVTARAVAPLARLADWGLPLLETGGSLLALKGRSAQEELDGARAAVMAAGGGAGTVLYVGTAVLDEPATVVRIDLLGQPLPAAPATDPLPARRRAAAPRRRYDRYSKGRSDQA